MSSKLKVLVAEDDEDQLALRALLLGKNGFETIQAIDAGSALREAKARKPDCALVDLRLPTEERGLELIRKLKAFDSQMRIFVLTGADENRLATRKERELIEGIVVKGSSSRDLIERLRAIAVRKS